MLARKITSDIHEAIKGKDYLIIATRQRDYQNLQLGDEKCLTRMPIIIDGRNVLDQNE